MVGCCKHGIASPGSAFASSNTSRTGIQANLKLIERITISILLQHCVVYYYVVVNRIRTELVVGLPPEMHIIPDT